MPALSQESKACSAATRSFSTASSSVVKPKTASDLTTSSLRKSTAVRVSVRKDESIESRKAEIEKRLRELRGERGDGSQVSALKQTDSSAGAPAEKPKLVVFREVAMLPHTTIGDGTCNHPIRDFEDSLELGDRVTVTGDLSVIEEGEHKQMAFLGAVQRVKNVVCRESLAVMEFLSPDLTRKLLAGRSGTVTKIFTDLRVDELGIHIPDAALIQFTTEISKVFLSSTWTHIEKTKISETSKETKAKKEETEDIVDITKKGLQTLENYEKKKKERDVTLQKTIKTISDTSLNSNNVLQEILKKEAKKGFDANGFLSREALFDFPESLKKNSSTQLRAHGGVASSVPNITSSWTNNMISKAATNSLEHNAGFSSPGTSSPLSGITLRRGSTVSKALSSSSGQSSSRERVLLSPQSAGTPPPQKLSDIKVAVKKSISVASASLPPLHESSSSESLQRKQSGVVNPVISERSGHAVSMREASRLEGSRNISSVGNCFPLSDDPVKTKCRMPAPSLNAVRHESSSCQRTADVVRNKVRKLSTTAKPEAKPETCISKPPVKVEKPLSKSAKSDCIVNPKKTAVERKLTAVVKKEKQ